jgi:aminoglycoside 6'-N-acetyltransferase
MSPPAHGSHALIFEGEVPIGYVRWTYVDRVTLDELGLYDVPANSVDIDILIGVASCTGNGRGVEALNLLAKQFLTDPAVPMLGLTTSLQNHQAQKAFSKAGFSISRQYDPNGFGLCYLMLRDLRKERGSVSSPSA